MTPEMQVIQQLLLYVLFTGFFTGIFFSHRFFDLLEFIYRVYKRLKRKDITTGKINDL